MPYPLALMSLIPINTINHQQVPARYSSRHLLVDVWYKDCQVLNRAACFCKAPPAPLYQLLSYLANAMQAISVLVALRALLSSSDKKAMDLRNLGSAAIRGEPTVVA